MTYTTSNYVDGKLSKPKGSRFSPIYNPAIGEQQGKVGLSSKAAVSSAIASAAKAQPAWAAVPAARRAEVLMRFKQLVNDNSAKLARIMSEEHGKTLPDALGEIARAVEIISYCLGIPDALKGEYSRAVARGVNVHNDRMPLGVVAGITPFNFPTMVPIWMLVPAIACGNSFVLKPSERDPSSSIFCAKLFSKAGLPDGVLNVVHGDKEAVDALLHHPDIKAISFVGSTPIARYIYSTAAANGKRVQALGGAKNHMVVMPDADIVQAADALMGAAYGAAGERCMAVSVAVTVGKKTGDALVEELAPRVRKLRIGSGVAKDIDMGPLITGEHRDKVAGYIAAGEKEGAEVVVDGRKWKKRGCEKGFFLGGTLLDNVKSNMSVYTDEIFGPVLSVVRAKSASDALELVNSHEYGNGAAIFTRDGQAAQQFAEQVEAGMVGVNVPIPVPVGYHSFGGWKNSFFGSSVIYGPEGVRFYTRLKTVTTRWPGSKKLGADFAFPNNAI